MTNPFKYIQALIQYYRAKLLADENHRRTGQRYYVISTTNRKLVVGDKKGLRLMDYNYRKSTGKFRDAKNLSVQRLEHSAFYYTAYADDVKGKLPKHLERLKRSKCIKYITHKDK